MQVSAASAGTNGRKTHEELKECAEPDNGTEVSKRSHHGSELVGVTIELL